MRGRQASVEVWAAKGVVPVDVAGLSGGWTVLVPVGPHSAVAAPYDDAVPLLLSRPVPMRLRPALGLAVRGQDAVVTLVPRRWRARQRWLVWGAGEGLVRPGDLPVASLSDLVAASGVRDPRALASLREVVADVAGQARVFLADLLVVLGLPGGDLIDGSARIGQLSVSRRVTPPEEIVAGFEAAVHEERLWREELGL